MQPFKDCSTEEEVITLHKKLKAEIDAEIAQRFGERKKQLSRAAQNRKKAIRDKLDRETHERVKDWQRGETIYMDELNMVDMSLETVEFVNSFQGVTRGTVYHYQPRKKLLWLKFKKGVTESQWHDHDGCPLQPFRLSDVRRHNMRRTDV